MRSDNRGYEDRIDRKTRIADRRHRDEIRESDRNKYMAEEEDSEAQSAPHRQNRQNRQKPHAT